MKKILILSVNPEGTTRLRLDREVREIQATLKGTRYRDRFEIVNKGAVRVGDLRRALLDCHPAIVHFSGHGVGKNGLVLEDDLGQAKLVSSEALASLFQLFQTQIECVLLNACYSEVQAQVIHQYIDYVIGMNRPIGDEAAIKFATGFYDALGAGESYEKCFEMGRASIDLEGVSESDTPQIKFRPRRYSLVETKEMGESKKTIDSFLPRSQNNTSQVMSFSGGTFSNSQIGQAGRDIKQHQQIGNGSIEKSLTAAEVLELASQIEIIVYDSDLPEKYKQKILTHLETIQEEIQEAELDKKFAAKNLQRLRKALKEADKFTQSGRSLLQKIEPIFTKLAPWFGVDFSSSL